jgi:hypothetical protein
MHSNKRTDDVESWLDRQTVNNPDRDKDDGN